MECTQHQGQMGRRSINQDGAPTIWSRCLNEPEADVITVEVGQLDNRSLYLVNYLAGPERATPFHHLFCPECCDAGHMGGRHASPGLDGQPAAVLRGPDANPRSDKAGSCVGEPGNHVRFLLTLWALA